MFFYRTPACHPPIAVNPTIHALYKVAVDRVERGIQRALAEVHREPSDDSVSCGGDRWVFCGRRGRSPPIADWAAVRAYIQCRRQP